MNILNYFNHILYKPEIIHRRFDFDIDQKTLKRIATAALPFLGMYKPAGFVLSVSASVTRSISCLQKTFQEEQKPLWQKKETVIKTAVSLIAFSSLFFAYKPALFISSASDAVESSLQALENQSVEEALQALSSILYLGFMGSGYLELMALFYLLQIVTSLIQAYNDKEEGNHIEAFSKFLLSCFRVSYLKNSVQLVQKKNLFLRQKREADLLSKIAEGKRAFHLMFHPLSSLQERIEAEDLSFYDLPNGEAHLGSHFHELGKTLVKGENLSFRIVKREGKEVIELSFQVNHAFREELEQNIKNLQKISKKNLQQILTIAGSNASDISINTNGSFDFIKENLSSLYLSYYPAYEIVAKGLGTICVGSDPSTVNLYDKVTVQMNSQESLYSLHELLSLVGLNNALRLSTLEDIERLKMGHLFRTFFPREALSLERSLSFFTLPLQDLQQKMFSLAPDAEEVFATYYEGVKPYSIMGGKIRYKIEGLSKAVYEEGARALTAAITGGTSEKNLFERVASILKIGMIAPETRHMSRIDSGGLSSENYITGGADSVFTQLITENICKEGENLEELWYNSAVRLVISLDVLELGSYQYHGDNFGSRSVEDNFFWWWWLLESYQERDNILEFIRKEQNQFNYSNEVMLKDRIDPSFFTGIIVPNAQIKSKLISYLKKEGLLENGLILNIPVDRFIRVGTQFSEELFS